ncbi:MAG: hypothetical protein MJZ15_00035 [Bacteroidales bacterium]|nr:hypothetical protein [Bacteroidales bacterium]
MKTYYFILAALCLAFISCDKNNDDDGISLKYTKVIIRNLSSSDMKISVEHENAETSYFIASNSYGAEQILEYINGGHDSVDIDGKDIPIYSFYGINIEIGDSILCIPPAYKIGSIRLFSTVKSIDRNCYSEVLVKDTIKEVYTFTDETIQKLIYYYLDGYDIDIVKHE